MSDSYKYSRPQPTAGHRALPYDQGPVVDDRDLVIFNLTNDRAELQYALNTVARLIDNLDPKAITRDEQEGPGVLSAALDAILLVIDPYVP